MKIHQEIDQLPVFKNPVITIGSFDGVHLGHLSLIERIHKRAKELQGESIIITFEPHPRIILSKNPNKIELLCTLSEKLEMLKHVGIDHLVIVPFDKTFASLSARAYLEDFLVKYFHPHTLIIGYDHHFGHERSGNHKFLESEKKKYGFEVEEIPAKEIDEIAVSSTKIRNALKEGDIENANFLLGKKYSMLGTVIHGEKKGRLLGFPTANLLLETDYKLVPANGVYAVEVLFEGSTFSGMMNIGTRPTISNETKRNLEVHLFNFSEEIYGKSLMVYFKKRLRDEQKFENVAALIEQLGIDKEMAQRL